ncbi:MAG TPA: polysaccharide deacetylase family protein [Polyangiaceae bacterium]|nr:polysaccharide deacetylase family protein [Polyangiaceae bacterium]
MTRVALSFDNGPDPDVTPRVLDALAARGIRAHFFVLGRLLAAPAGRAAAERARAEGHVLGNHSFSHETPLGDDPRPDAVAREIAATERLLGPLAAAPRLFRPFGGGGALGPHLLSPAAVDHLVAEGYSCVLWNSVPRDWDDPTGWPARALADCARGGHLLVVLHDVAGACLAALPRFLDEARGRGVEFVADLPAACVPIEGGRVRADLAGLVRAPPGAT